MDGKQGYAVFFFPPALEALGDAIKPYLVEGPAGIHLLCSEIDTGGALVEMTLDGLGDDGAAVELEIMVPSNMVRMIVSVRGEGAFGFGPRMAMAPDDVPARTPAVAAAPASPVAANADADAGDGAAAAADAVVAEPATEPAAEPVEAPRRP